MKKHLFPLFILLVACLAGCSDDDSPKNIALGEGTQTTQTVYADQTSAEGGGITFTALTDWTATVVPVTKATGGSSVEWLTLSAYGGGPGTYTLTLTLTENTTGQDRAARIEIVCGGDKITIMVEQKGITQDEADDDEQVEPPLPQGSQLTRVEYTSINSEYPDSYDKFIVTMAYDAQGRISEMHDISYTGDYQGYYSDAAYTFTYHDGGMELVITDGDYTEHFVATLDEAGRMTSIYEKPEYEGSSTELWEFHYTADGYLQRVMEDYMFYPDDQDGGDDDEVNVPGYDGGPAQAVLRTRANADKEILRLEWEGGNLMATYGEWSDEPYMTWEYTSYTNDTPNFDFNVLSAATLFGYHDYRYGDVTNMLYAIGWLGENSKHLVKADQVAWSYSNGAGEDPDGNPIEPTTETRHDDSWAPFDYTFTAENYLQRVTARCTMKRTVVEIATGTVLEESVSYIDDEYLFTYE